MSTEITAVQSGLIVWGSRDEVRELNERLKIMLPGGEKLNDKQRLALAQASIAHSLDPFNGEIYMIPGSGLMIGIKGLRKKAHEQVQGNFWPNFREISNEDERNRLLIPEGALAFEARLFDSENIRLYVEAVSQLLKAGIPWEAVKEMIGDKPYTSGIGIFRKGEKTRMEPVQCAMKRAEADAIKRRFDVPFGLAVDVESDTDAEYAGNWSDAIDGDVVQHDATDEEMAARLAVKCECGHAAEEHGVKLNCEVEGCSCKKFTEPGLQERLQHGKKALGRDDGGLG